MSFNKIIIVGNLGKDPDLRFTPQGVAVCSFTMATNTKGKDKEDVTTWFKVTLWRQQAENAAKYLKKSSAVYIEGRLNIEEWTDRDGKSRYTLDVQGTDMHFISGGKSEDIYEPALPLATGAPKAMAAAATSEDDSEIPF